MKIFKKCISNTNLSHSSSSPAKRIDWKFTNSNIFLMQKFNNYRNNILHVNLKKCDLVFQTFWSDFAHLTLLGKNENSGNLFEKIDYTNYNDDSNAVFQDESSFIDYKCEKEVEKHKIQIDHNYQSIASKTSLMPWKLKEQ